MFLILICAVALVVPFSDHETIDFLLKVAAIFGAGALLERRFGRIERKVDYLFHILPKPAGYDPGPFEEKKYGPFRIAKD